MRLFRLFACNVEHGGGVHEFYVEGHGFKDAMNRVLRIIREITGNYYSFEDGDWCKNWQSSWMFPHRTWDGPGGYQVDVQDLNDI